MPNISFYRCKTCGNVMVMILNGDVPQTCCEQSMTKLEPNTTDGAKEKHIPVIINENSDIHVAVGSKLHPMLPEHYIEWITLDTGKKTDFVYLEPGFEPKAYFGGVNSGTVYSYCSVHGLWKAEF